MSVERPLADAAEPRFRPDDPVSRRWVQQLHPDRPLLSAQQGDAGCEAGGPIMDQYVEVELRLPEPTR